MELKKFSTYEAVRVSNASSSKPTPTKSSLTPLYSSTVGPGVGPGVCPGVVVVGGSAALLLGFCVGWELGAGDFLASSESPLLSLCEGGDEGCPVGGTLGSPVGLADTVGGAKLR